MMMDARDAQTMARSIACRGAGVGLAEVSAAQEDFWTNAAIDEASIFASFNKLKGSAAAAPLSANIAPACDRPSRRIDSPAASDSTPAAYNPPAACEPESSLVIGIIEQG